MSGPEILSLASEVGELAQRARLCAIHLAVASAKAKLADPAFRNANERVIQLVTRATEAAAAVERLARALSGQGTDLVAEPEHGSLGRLEACAEEVEEISRAIAAEVKRLVVQNQPRQRGTSLPGS